MKAARFFGVGLVLAGFGIASAAEPAILNGLIKDAVTGQPTACTVAITDANGKVIIESPSFQSGFRCAGQFRKTLPPGRTRVRVSRGFETKALTRELDLVAGAQADLELTLERVVDLRQRGWYSGDSHVHMLHGEKTVPVNFDFIALTAQAEDLQFMSLAQSWDLADPTPEALAAELNPRSRPNCVLTWNLEAPKNYYKGDAGRCLGHCWNFGAHGRTEDGRDVIHELLQASAWDYESEKPTYANFESHRLIHEEGGAVFYTHPARWWWGSWGGQGGYPRVERMRVSNMAVELPLDTLVGPTFDGVDLLTTSGEQAANAKAFTLWAMLLNHGYRLAATASSDACFDRPGGGVPGGTRTYAFLPKGFSIPETVRAMAGGRTFATTGPLLVAAMDGNPPGSVCEPGDREHGLSIEAWGSGDDPHGLVKVEILRNGEVFRTFGLNAGTGFFQTNVLIRQASPGWYCARAFEAEGRKAITSAFYFANKNQHPPPPVPAGVHVVMVGADSGRPLAGRVTELVYEGTIGVPGKWHSIKHGEGHLTVPGTVRLCAESPGYRPLILSPFLDSPEIVATVTGLNDSDLLDWKTFDRLRDQLGRIELVFRMQHQ